MEAKGVILSRVDGCLIDDCPCQKEYGIILYDVFATVNPKETWLAVNPQLALDMGLRLNENEGSFRWDDKKGTWL